MMAVVVLNSLLRGERLNTSLARLILLSSVMSVSLHELVDGVVIDIIVTHKLINRAVIEVHYHFSDVRPVHSLSLLRDEYEASESERSSHFSFY